MNRIETPKPDVRISMFTKGAEHYVLCFNDRKSAGEALRMLGRWAGNSELSINWYDAASWAQRLRGVFAELEAECKGK
ncbi:MAG: hypothetical protein KGL35_19020 [Bradyrhizobium sp.]|nr:hypothetical protein [Bradyrhizobium sp.]